jgi:hypothetical protein
MFVDGPIQSEIHVIDHRSQPMQIQELSTSAPGLQARLAGEERDKSGRLVRKVQLQVAGDFPEGRHEEFVSVFTSDPDYREIRIPVTIVKRPQQRLSATPSRIELIHRPGTSLPSRTVLIRDRENEEVEVETVKADSPAITCRWAKGPGTMTTVRIQIDDSKIEDRRSKIEDRTGDTRSSILDPPSSKTWETSVRVQVIKPTRQTILIPITVRVSGE